MTTSSFQVDMEMVPEHVDTYSEPVPSESPKEDSHINGLTPEAIKAMKIKEHIRSIVVVCSEKNRDAACAFKESLEVKQGVPKTLLICKDFHDLSPIIVPSVQSLYLLVDMDLYELLMNRRRRVLRDLVYDFMEALEQRGKLVYVVNQINTDDHLIKTLFYQLPKACAKWYHEIRITTEHKLETATISDNSAASQSYSATHENSNQQTDKITPVGDGSSFREGESARQIISGTDGRGDVRGGIEKIQIKNDQEEISASSGPLMLFASPVHDVGSMETVGQDETAVAPVPHVGKMMPEISGGRSNAEVPGINHENTEESSSDVTAVQIGSHMTMNLHWSDGQAVIARQEGNDNTVSVNIVPNGTKSKTVIVVTTNPNDPVLNQLLVKEIDGQSEVINVNMQSLDSSLVHVTSGSIVLEIEVKPGQKMDNEWMKKVLKTVFNDKVTSVLPDGTVLDVDIESKMVVPIDQLGQYVYLNQEDLHRDCVSREKYDEKVKEVEQLERRLISGKLGDRCANSKLNEGNGILENPKHDLVLHRALRKFVSSIVSDAAFAFVVEQQEITRPTSKTKPEVGTCIQNESLQTCISKEDNFLPEEQSGSMTVVHHISSPVQYLEQSGIDPSLPHDRESGGLALSDKDDSTTHKSKDDRSEIQKFAEKLAQIADTVGDIEEKGIIPEVIQRVLRKSHTVWSKKLDVSLYQPENSEPVIDETLMPYTIVVQGVGGMSDDLLEMYFENRRRSGGGEVRSFRRSSDEDKAFITFCDEEVVQQVLAKTPHRISNKELHVSVYKEEKTHHKILDTIVVRGGRTISEDTLCMYFENKRRSGGGEVKAIRRGSDKDTAYITFDIEEGLALSDKDESSTHKSKDDRSNEFQRIVEKLAQIADTVGDVEEKEIIPEVIQRVLRKSHTVWSKKLDVSLYQPENSEPVIDETLMPNTIVVQGVGGMSDDLLEMYFENRLRSGGGEVRSFRRSSDKDKAFITFCDEEVVQQVLAKTPHRISNKELHVSVYKEEKTHHKILDTIVVRGGRTISEDTLCLYFENKRRSGGGEVKAIRKGSDPDTAYITFDIEEDMSELERSIISSLRARGDSINLQTLSPSELESVYKRFSSSVRQSMGDDISWNQISLLFHATKKVIGAGSKMANLVKDLTTRYVTEELSPWIINQGGWNSVVAAEAESELD